jgi:hypothetical protein
MFRGCVHPLPSLISPPWGIVDCVVSLPGNSLPLRAVRSGLKMQSVLVSPRNKSSLDEGVVHLSLDDSIRNHMLRGNSLLSADVASATIGHFPMMEQPGLQHGTGPMLEAGSVAVPHEPEHVQQQRREAGQVPPAGTGVVHNAPPAPVPAAAAPPQQQPQAGSKGDAGRPAATQLSDQPPPLPSLAIERHRVRGPTWLDFPPTG